MSALAWIIVLGLAAAILIALAAWFYERATNEVSLVRTGVGGRKVVIDGGTLAIPYFHEINRVNMQTIRMDVVRRGESALITKDRMRVDVGAEFYASVVPEAGAIARAAQTLGASPSGSGGPRATRSAMAPESRPPEGMGYKNANGEANKRNERQRRKSTARKTKPRPGTQNDAQNTKHKAQHKQHEARHEEQKQRERINNKKQK